MLGDWNNDRKKITFLFCLILIVMVSVTSITYAYFALTATDNSIVGIVGQTGLELDVEKVFPLSGDNTLVPQLEAPLTKAISTQYSCIDDNGNAVCQVYRATITNTSTAAVKLDGTISFTGIDNMPNLKWKRIKDERIIGGYQSYNATTTDAYFEKFELFDPSESKTYYFVVWIDEIGTTQTDSGTFRTTIKFDSSDGEGLTSTVVPMSYMTGFTSSSDYSYYRSDAYREKIKNVYFVDYIDTTSAVANWDMTDTEMSEVGSVMAWVKTNTSDNNYYDLYIGSEMLITGFDFSYLFRGLSVVEGIYFDNFDTRETIDMKNMFRDCKKLITLDISSFDTSKVTNMQAMFWNSVSLTNLNLSWFDVSNVIDMSYMFGAGAGFYMNLKYLDVSDWDTSKVKDMQTMFQNCIKLVNLDVSNWNTFNVTNMKLMFSAYQAEMALEYLDVSGWDTSNVTSMGSMFQNCSQLVSLDVSNWNTSNVIDMSRMFQSCVKLSLLDVSDWNTVNVTNMMAMFSNCVKLTTLNVNYWNTINVTNMMAMFGGESNYIMNLTNLNLNNWNVSKVTNMQSMFQNCAYLTTIINIKNSGVTNYDYMFFGSSTESGAGITVNYTSATSSLVDSMIATKSDNSNVVKGSLVT